MDRDHWFAAKRYGWGWGLPARWQGWAVLALWAVVMTVSWLALMPGSPRAYLGVVLAASALFVLVCYWKGERPRWRWGGDGDRRPHNG